jgi:excinuclease ABC subunit C
MNSSLAEKLKNLPNRPGVYQFKNDQGKIIYVGKAKNLKNRVGSYFHIDLSNGTKTSALVARINDIELIEVESEFDALILEAELIKKYKPKYNIIQKDDKTYLYIIIRNETFELGSEKITLPKLITVRKTELLPKDVKFGPYPDGTTAKFVVRTLRKLFPYRDCSISKFNTYHRKGRPCLYGELGLCSAPCIKFSKDEITEYKKSLSNIKKILTGGSFSVLNELNKKMSELSKLKDYEQAAKYRDLISKYNYVRQRYKLPEVYMENPTFIDDQAEASLKSLMTSIPILKNLPNRIECYDISNISGTEAVGSMVVAEEGKITKKEYKRFKIKYKKTPDDFEMIYEVISRRSNHRDDWPKPDLLLIDGGKGQVSSAMAAVDHNGWDATVAGLAKREETIVYREGLDFIEVKLDKNDVGLKLLIRLRDEAHRFAQAYHHKLRAKALLPKD